jgi:hypothetical protein
MDLCGAWQFRSLSQQVVPPSRPNTRLVADVIAGGWCYTWQHLFTMAGQFDAIGCTTRHQGS